MNSDPHFANGILRCGSEETNQKLHAQVRDIGIPPHTAAMDTRFQYTLLMQVHLTLFFKSK